MPCTQRAASCRTRSSPADPQLRPSDHGPGMSAELQASQRLQIRPQKHHGLPPCLRQQGGGRPRPPKAAAHQPATGHQRLDTRRHSLREGRLRRGRCLEHCFLVRFVVFLIYFSPNPFEHLHITEVLEVWEGLGSCSKVKVVARCLVKPPGHVVSQQPFGWALRPGCWLCFSRTPCIALRDGRFGKEGKPAAPVLASAEML